MSEGRLFADEIGARLDGLLFPSRAYRSAASLATDLEKLSRAQQEKLLHWVAVAAKTHADTGALIVSLASRAFALLDEAGFDAWVLAGLDAFDQQGEATAQALLNDLEGFRAKMGGNQPEVKFAEIESRLTRFLQGLSGRPLKLSANSGKDADAWTDTETIYLPPELAEESRAADNRKLYKILAVMLWAQTHFGTFGSQDDNLVAALTPWSNHSDRERAMRWLAALEAVRLEARILADLPGLGAEIAAARGPWPASLEAVRASLYRPDATLADTLAVLANCMQGNEDAPRLKHGVALDFSAVWRDQVALGTNDTTAPTQSTPMPESPSGRSGHHDEKKPSSPNSGSSKTASGSDKESTAPYETYAVSPSQSQDAEESLPDRRVPTGQTPWQQITKESDETITETPSSSPEPDHLYDEWDYRRKAYRRGWCHLFETEVQAGSADYVETVKARHAALIGRLRRSFEALRGEERMLGRQPEGEEVDVDALVDAVSDRRKGVEPSTRLFCRSIRNQRSVAAMFMVDMSGSTKGWVNDAEREALVIHCEALEALGDAYAIYGFSGNTKNHCDIYRIKRFDEQYDSSVRARIAAVEAKDYTRMGVAIRHLTQLLLRQPARHRLLITLSDGRPDDFGDDYRGQYGIEDTRRALQEAHDKGVRSYCITIDRHGADYLAHMYGAARYTVLDDVRKLPLKVADIYRRLAS